MLAHAILETATLKHAILASILASIAAGIMGSYVVIKKISSISGSISHSIIGGIGLSVFLQYKYKLFWFNYSVGAFLVAIFSAFLIGYMHVKHRQKEDSAIAMVWVTGMALGILFLSFVPSYSEHVTHFLFGDIFHIKSFHLYMLVILDVFILLMVPLFYKKFLLVCFDEELATLQNLKTNFLYLFLIVMISISIVVLLQIVGIILIIAILTIPTNTAKIFSKKLYNIMIFSFVFCLFSTLLGTFISYKTKIPAGAVSSLTAISLYFLCLIFTKNFKKLNLKKSFSKKI